MPFLEHPFLGTSATSWANFPMPNVLKLHFRGRGVNVNEGCNNEKMTSFRMGRLRNDDDTWIDYKGGGDHINIMDDLIYRRPKIPII